MVKTLFIILILFSGTVQASTFTVIVPELSQEQKDWNSITDLSDDTITAMRLAKEDSKYDYLEKEITKRQAILQIQKRNEERRKRLKIGHASHVYPCHIENEVKKIEAEDLAIESGLGEGGFASIWVMILMAIGGLFTLLFRKRKP